MNIFRALGQRLFPEIQTRYLVASWLRFPGIWLADFRLRNFRQRLQPWRGRFNGSRCFLMGNGPSLNATALHLLKDEYVWGMNRCYLLYSRISWRPAFYVAVDTRVVPDNATEINGQIWDYPDTAFFFPFAFGAQKIIRSADNVFWFNEIMPEENHTAPRFSETPEIFTYAVPTVTLSALQLAVFMGFNPIYLIGCDTDYHVPQSSRYEANDEHIVAQADDDPNHFAANYFGVGKKYHEPHPEKMIAGYEVARSVCRRIGVDVFNATVGGKLEVFPRVDLEALF